MRMAIVKIDPTETALVENVIDIEPDEAGGFSHWTCPDGFKLVEAAENVSADWLWDGNELLPPPFVPTPRIDELMRGETQVLNEETDTMVDRPAEDIAADKTELLGLLRAKLAASEDLTWNEMNKMLALMLALERE